MHNAEITGAGGIIASPVERRVRALEPTEKEMSFADWKRRSEACENVMTHSVPTRSNILRALQAAYKAGERAGRKQVEAVAENATRLAVLAEREGIAQYCEVRMCRDGRPHTCGASLAAGIRARSNCEVSGLSAAGREGRARP